MGKKCKNQVSILGGKIFRCDMELIKGKCPACSRPDQKRNIVSGEGRSHGEISGKPDNKHRDMKKKSGDFYF